MLKRLAAAAAAVTIAVSLPVHVAVRNLVFSHHPPWPPPWTATERHVRGICKEVIFPYGESRWNF